MRGGGHAAGCGCRSRARSATFSLLARAHANQGKLARPWHGATVWIAADKLDSAGHYLRAIVLIGTRRPGAGPPVAAPRGLFQPISC